MRQATLPERLEEVTLQDMCNGESGYTVPWAMYADENSWLWLNGNYNFRKTPGGTVTMKVSKKDGEFIVDTSMCQDEKWIAGNPSFVGNFTPLPVAKLI